MGVSITGRTCVTEGVLWKGEYYKNNIQEANEGVYLKESVYEEGFRRPRKRSTYRAEYCKENLWEAKKKVYFKWFCEDVSVQCKHAENQG